MFGNADWFCEREGRQRIRAASWQGRLYRGVWLAAIVLPAILLFGQDKTPEALVWLTASGGLFAWDWHHIKKGLGQAKSTASRDNAEVLYIGDEEPPVRVATQHFSFFAKR